MGQNVGPFVVVAGIIIAAVGILMWAGGLSWFGHLPGDIRIERENVRICGPTEGDRLPGLVRRSTEVTWEPGNQAQGSLGPERGSSE